MEYSKLQDAKNSFNIENSIEERKKQYRLRKDFVKKFPEKMIPEMRIEDFAIGQQNQDSFCYWIEIKLGELGLIKGARADKFGVYYDKKGHAYRFTKKFGDTYQTAFENIKQEIFNLLQAGKHKEIDSLVSNRISPMFKGKILSLYYPELYLNIFSVEHLNHYLKVLNLDTADLMKKDAVIKREALVNYKNRDKDMKEWDIDIFGKFLYTYFSPKNNNQDTDNKFPSPTGYRYVNLSLDLSQTHTPQEDKEGKHIKLDYEKQSKKFREYGSRGEMIVMMAEKDRLSKLGYSTKTIEELLIQQSIRSDDFGYDILSVNDDGSERYIEVKATTGKIGDMDFYYTQNEFEKAKKYGVDYYFYIVFQITSPEPKIWVLQNPFLSGQLEMKPVQYKVSLHTTK